MVKHLKLNDKQYVKQFPQAISEAVTFINNNLKYRNWHAEFMIICLHNFCLIVLFT